MTFAGAYVRANLGQRAGPLATPNGRIQLLRPIELGPQNPTLLILIQQLRDKLQLLHANPLPTPQPPRSAPTPTPPPTPPAPVGSAVGGHASSRRSHESRRYATEIQKLLKRPSSSLRQAASGAMVRTGREATGELATTAGRASILRH